jgi:hypothetical protein
VTRQQAEPIFPAKHPKPENKEKETVSEGNRKINTRGRRNR